MFLIGLSGICTQTEEKRIIGKQGVSRGIMVYIPKHEDSVMMKQAFGEWTKATNGKITFKFISSPQTTQIRVYFVDTAQNYNVCWAYLPNSWKYGKIMKSLGR